MSQFYGDLQGNRGEATRGGSKDSGMNGHIRGWHLGGRVWMRNLQNGEDEVTFDITCGSNGTGQTHRILVLTQSQYNDIQEGKLVLVPATVKPT